MERSKTIQEYFDSLERLKINKPINIPLSSPINKDTVALESGRKRGAIKKSRPMFKELVDAIDKEEIKIKKPRINAVKAKEEAETNKRLYEEALARELMYLERINELEKNFKIHKISPINNV